MPRDTSSALNAPARDASTDIPRTVVRLIGRYYFGTASILCAVAALLVAAFPAGAATRWRVPLLVSLLVFALGCGWGFAAAHRRGRPMHLPAFLTGLGV